eukprot:16436085-Heterocapsa_arctica.AAC.2
MASTPPPAWGAQGASRIYGALNEGHTPESPEASAARLRSQLQASRGISHCKRHCRPGLRLADGLVLLPVSDLAPAVRRKPEAVRHRREADQQTAEQRDELRIIHWPGQSGRGLQDTFLGDKEVGEEEGPLVASHSELAQPVHERDEDGAPVR